jgi:hypothetical protein
MGLAFTAAVDLVAVEVGKVLETLLLVSPPVIGMAFSYGLWAIMRSRGRMVPLCLHGRDYRGAIARDC